MRMRRISLAVIGIGGVLALTACSGHSGIQALDEQFASEDALPAAVDLGDAIDRESSRHLTTHEQVRYFVAASPDSSLGCIIVVPPGADPHWFSGCSSLGATDVIMTASTPPSGLAASLVRDDADTRELESEGWIRIHDNVLVPGP
uniref:hypothetical protein n=1 Tax=Glutamicibacter sp. AOP38-B1-38 TaxID=3457680 RepID=UPI0040341EC5